MKDSLEVFLCLFVSQSILLAGLCLLWRWGSTCICMYVCMYNKQWCTKVQPLWCHCYTVTVKSCQQCWLSVTDSICRVARLMVVCTATLLTLSVPCCQQNYVYLGELPPSFLNLSMHLLLILFIFIPLMFDQLYLHNNITFYSTYNRMKGSAG